MGPMDVPETVELGVKLLRDNPGWKLRNVFGENNIVAGFFARKARSER